MVSQPPENLQALHSGEPTSTAQAAPFESRLDDLMLEQYKALAAENQTRISAQVTLVGFVLTGAAALSAVALSGGTLSGSRHPHADNRLLLFLLVPLVVNGLGFFYILHNTARGRIAAFTRDIIYAAFTTQRGDWSWTTYQLGVHPTRRLLRSVVIVIANLAIFTTFDAVALLLVRVKAAQDSTGTAIVWWMDCAFSIGLIVAAVLSAREFGLPIKAPLYQRVRLPARQ